MKNYAVQVLFLLFSYYSILFSQTAEAPLRFFGYFQSEFNHRTPANVHPARNSFSVQQLNLFLHKDLGKNWTALANLEFVNSFSSNRRWGSFSLEEAWIRYYHDVTLNVKLGLQTPIFNNFNEINNRTPLLIYVVRPLAYETSFSEFIDIESFTPKRAYLQIYGFLPAEQFKLDYSVYMGNSPNINSDTQIGQTGADTSSTFRFGGRLGLRFRELKAGFSATIDKMNKFRPFAAEVGLPPSAFEELSRIRLGGDLSYNSENFFFESEIIRVSFDDDYPQINIDKTFYYLTGGFRLFDDLAFYASYWFTKENFTLKSPNIPESRVIVKVPNIGAAYDLSDRIRMKFQAARVDVDASVAPKQTGKYYYIGGAVSVFL